MWEIWNTAPDFSFSPFTSFFRPLRLSDLPSNAWSNTVCTALLQRSAMVNTCIKQIFQLIRLTYLQVTSVTPKPTLQNSQNSQFKKVFSFLLLMSVWYDYNSHVKGTALTVNAYRHIFLVFFSSHLEETWLKGKGRGAVMAFISNAGSETLQRSCAK